MQSSITHQQDPANPWENPPGDLTVRFFFEGVGTDRRIFRCGPEAAALPGTVYLLGRRAHLPASSIVKKEETKIK
jgi:hypothetical protein